MAQSSIAIKRENKDREYYDQVKQPTDPTDQEVKGEESPVPSLPTVHVCPINVIQGDSILVKLKYKGVFWFIHTLIY